MSRERTKSSSVLQIINNDSEELLHEHHKKDRVEFTHVPPPSSWRMHHDDLFVSISPYLIETLGTFFLTLTIGLNVVEIANNPDAAQHAPLAIGSALMVLVFFGGHLSGAHYNPAVTIGAKLTFRDHIGWIQSGLYIFCQVAGAIIAGIVYWKITDTTFEFQPGPDYSDLKAIIVESIYTFLLVSVMINTATTTSQMGNSFFGLAIGFTVLTAGYSIGYISGAVLNPAVATGAAVVNAINNNDISSMKHLWIYWLAPGIGGIIAGAVFRITNAKEWQVRKKEEKEPEFSFAATHGVPEML